MNRNILIACLFLANISLAAGWRLEYERVAGLRDQYAHEEAEFYELVFGDCKREAERLKHDRIALQQQWIKLMLHP